MARQAKVKASGDIINVRARLDYLDNTTWIDIKTGDEYDEKDLEIFPNWLYKETAENLKIAKLREFSDSELKEELKRREKERRSKFPSNIRCRDCKHCIEGLTFRHQVRPTTICRVKPKPSQGPDRFYSTSYSFRACEKYKPKK